MLHLVGNISKGIENICFSRLKVHADKIAVYCQNYTTINTQCRQNIESLTLKKDNKIVSGFSQTQQYIFFF